MSFGSDNCRTLVLTSPSYKEGKSTTTVNLAISMVQDEKKVLIIDANVRKPTIHHMFKIKNEIGLTNVLSGQATLEETINQSEFAGLDVLTSGPIPLNTEALFYSELIEQFHEKEKDEYDLVLIDAPPVLEEKDTKIIAKQSDGVILVFRNGKTVDLLALEAKNMLELSNANLLGVILNAKNRWKII
ncbi:tyrosine-protein kinase family protein [Halalkalibacter nanhaiisediminis]|uniref:non-specific protein-tyrosine kinase n=1 Tax=Halalkalibacter nanhaiisediminis TaxID=688079 RepID=A0A562QN78_9BACI|nr:CpsD/CapB family tyrosine-protein kinase [Halalkalibacter nanhaiisediminis]TWI58123.1 protein-tyrosine kinase [Halalkalibacter nanhaiisediminis]